MDFLSRWSQKSMLESKIPLPIQVPKHLAPLFFLLDGSFNCAIQVEYPVGMTESAASLTSFFAWKFPNISSVHAHWCLIPKQAELCRTCLVPCHPSDV